ncbi:phosphatidate cytidylyltransferase [Micromonospora craniellae]|uniref:Phosphatidate cytidylyltransferase n=1 Tax=Micromonospora craniellae TaxID=2294034 RepID=A0A372G4D9_9ACTN|nr:phosphatidate cytidylyltransferase [Micromonospora craniellae]QOC94868.1 phosphatidate cytidylyltransferase [Micromonospora craniellae]RFS47838.1 phosphatidate cytidylyltransferase [Micromonospora craniellae]
MSHLDPYGGAEARGWDRPDRPTSLPWPDPDLEPGPWSHGPRPGAELSAEPRTRPRLPADNPYARPAEDRDGPAGTGFATRPEPYDDRDPRDTSDGDPRRAEVNGRRDLEHEDAPTAQLAPVRLGDGRDHDDAPTTQFAPVPAEEAPEPDADPAQARRHRGRRRAGAGRPATPQPANRAGRNLPAAITVGVCLGAAVLLPLFLYTPAFLLLIAAAYGVGIWEMSRAVRRGGARVPLVPLVSGGVLTVTLAWFAGLDALLLGLLVTVAGTLVWRLGDGVAGLRRDMTAATLIAVYVPFLGGFAALLASSPGDGPLRVLVTLVAVVLSDTGGYAAGANFGKHPMAPTISPKKSWEGLAGSLGAAALGSAVLLWLLFDVAPWWGAVFGMAISVAAVVGDLAESMIKRDLGVKDMSNLLPGHGGLMDRLDSVLFAVPTAYLLLVVFVPAVN